MDHDSSNGKCRAEQKYEENRLAVKDKMIGNS